MKKLMISLAVALFATSTLAQEKLIHKIPTTDKIIQIKQNLSCNDCSFPNEFNLTVWNMYKGKKDSWQLDFEELMSESDILLGQEFSFKGGMKDRLFNPQDEEIILATSFISWGKHNTGVTNISKYPSTQITPLRSTVREPFIRTPKLSLASQYKLEDGRTITFINIHAINFVKKKSLKKQISQVVNYIRSTNGPVIFAGDFNTNSKSKIKMMRKVLKDEGFSEVIYTGEDERMKWLGNKLDYIWYRDLEVISAQVRGDIEGSDHKPLQAKFRIPIE